MTAGATHTGVEETGAQEHAGRYRRARMSRFLRVLLAITAAVHVPVALGAVELGQRLGWPVPWLIGWAYAAVGVLLFVGRARAGMPDKRGRHPALVRLVDIPYFIHWCACVFTLIPALVICICLMFILFPDSNRNRNLRPADLKQLSVEAEK